MGYIKASICHNLKDIVFDRFKTQPPILNVFIDLSECNYIDSTFMGIIVGFNKKLCKASRKKVSIVNSSDICKNLLDNLGVLKLLEIVDSEVVFPGDLENISGNTSPAPDLLLNAHLNLYELSDANKKKFDKICRILEKRCKEKE